MANLYSATASRRSQPENLPFSSSQGVYSEPLSAEYATAGSFFASPKADRNLLFSRAAGY
jgi:hypothetical protein